MTDRDKAYLLKELTRTIDESDSTAEFCLCQRWILKNALALLKEIEPVQSGVDAEGVPRCGSCGWIQSYGCKYCDNCGKRLFWE